MSLPVYNLHMILMLHYLAVVEQELRNAREKYSTYSTSLVGTLGLSTSHEL